MTKSGKIYAKKGSCIHLVSGYTASSLSPYSVRNFLMNRLAISVLIDRITFQPVLGVPNSVMVLTSLYLLYNVLTSYNIMSECGKIPVVSYSAIRKHSTLIYACLLHR